MQAINSRIRVPILGDVRSAETEILLSTLPMPDEAAFSSNFFVSAPMAAEDRPLRASSYAIRVELGASNGEVLLVHGYTGAYDKISRNIAAYLRAREAGTAARPLHGIWSPEPPLGAQAEEPPPAVLSALVKRGYLTTLTIEEEQAFLSRIALKLHARSMRRLPDFIVIPTYACNLRCPYCFQDHMRTDPAYRHLLTTIPRDVVDRIVHAMAKIEKIHGVTDNGSRHVLLFGGEPLLGSNRALVEYILARTGEGRRTSFSAVTNGTELEVYTDMLGESGLSLLQITMDGVPDAHDKRRLYPGGVGSFVRIADNVSLALDKGANVRLQVNCNRHNVDGLPALAEEIVARGWLAYAGFSAIVSPIHAEERGAEILGSWELARTLESMKRQHPTLSMFRGPDDQMRYQTLGVLRDRREPLPSFTASMCSAHSTMYVFEPFAGIYACWERTGDPNIRIGRVTESGDVLVRRSVMESWRSRTVVSNPVCHQCRYALCCGGGCAAHAETDNGTIHSNHCDLLRAPLPGERGDRIRRAQNRRSSDRAGPRALRPLRQDVPLERCVADETSTSP